MKAKLKFIFLFEKLIHKIEANEILTPQGNYYKKSTVRNWSNKKQVFLDYEKNLEKTIFLTDINYKWAEKFTIWQMNKGYSKNTIANNNAILKVFIRRMWQENLTTYSGQGIRSSNEQTTSVYSNFEDLRAIYNLDLSTNKGLERVRDVYICQCFLGLRVSDMMRFLNQFLIMAKKIDERWFFEIKTQKTGEVVVIPASPMVKKIAKRRNYKFGKPFSQQYYSKSLKKIVRKAGIDRKMIFSRTEGGVMQQREVMYSDLIGTHTARRTFATNAYLMGVNPFDIMKITGHKTFVSFMRYVRCENMAVALRVSKHEFFNMEL